MNILVRCKCGKKISAPAKYSGRTVDCPACGGRLTIVSEEEKKLTESQSLIVFHCECGKKLRARPTAVGKQTKCPQCSSPITVPEPRPNHAEQPMDEDPSSSSILDDPTPAPGGTDISGLLDEIGAHECKTNRRCPNCKKDMERDDVVCIQCGYNSRTKKVMGKEKEPRGSAIISSVKDWFTTENE